MGECGEGYFFEQLWQDRCWSVQVLLVVSSVSSGPGWAGPHHVGLGHCHPRCPLHDYSVLPLHPPPTHTHPPPHTHTRDHTAT